MRTTRRSGSRESGAFAALLLKAITMSNKSNTADLKDNGTSGTTTHRPTDAANSAAPSVTSAKLKALRERVQAKLREQRERRAQGLGKVPTPPRYDEEFLDGVRWLDSL